jgi:hypothetical protein
MEGTMISSNPAKRHGFIQNDEGERLRVDEAGFGPETLLGDRCCGTKVRSDRMPGEQDEARAVDVPLAPLMAARRARLRGRR